MGVVCRIVTFSLSDERIDSRQNPHKTFIKIDRRLHFNAINDHSVRLRHVRDGRKIGFP
jgi:hypothetical protein